MDNNKIHFIKKTFLFTSLAFVGAMVSCKSNSLPKHKLEFKGVHAKMVNDLDEEITSPVEFEEGKIARYKLVGENSEYDLPPKVTFVTSDDKTLTDGYSYDNDTGYFEVKMDQDIIVNAESFTKDTFMVAYYDYHESVDGSTDNLVHLATRAGANAEGNIDARIDWGDGSPEEYFIDVDEKYLNHAYNGEKSKYQITFKGTPDTIKKIRTYSDPYEGAYNKYFCEGNKYLSEVILLQSIGKSDATNDIRFSSTIETPNVQHLTIGHLVDSIPYELFLNSDMTDLFIPKTVKTIAGGAFADTYNLSSITFENNSGIEKIGSRAFGNIASDYANRGVSSITLPSSLKQIDKGAFRALVNLKEVTCEAVVPPTQEQKGEIFCSDNLSHIYVPDGAIDSYKNDSTWSRYADIILGISEKK